TWWQVSYTTGVSGWSAETYLTAASTSSTAPTSTTSTISSLPAGHWYAVPNSNLTAVAPSPYDSRVLNVVTAWSGGTFDTNSDSLIVWGGGHGDYWGNEIYSFNVDTLKWTRLTDPYLPAQNYAFGTGAAVNPDGTPDSRHSYGGLAYLPNQNALWLTGGSTWRSGNGTASTMEFNFGTSQWNSVANSPQGTTDLSSAYDPVTGNVYAYWCGWLWEYSPSSNTWSTKTQGPCYSDGIVSAIDPVHQKMIIIGNGQAFIYDIAHGGGIQNLSATGAGASAMMNAYAPGLAYDSAIGELVGWAGGGSVYALDLSGAQPTWKDVSAVSSNTVSPPATSAHGTYGRWQYAPSVNAFVVVNGADQNVYFYKVSSGGGSITPTPTPTPTPQPSTPAPTLSLSASPTTVSSGGSTTLTWSTTNATACTASGAWSGSQATSGSQTLTNLQSSATYTLSCTGTGGSTSQSTSVSVTAAPVP
ncbi:MAG: hypothetical protein B7X04_04475, partial [Parcubacteria group bacterium 21-54-25]